MYAISRYSICIPMPFEKVPSNIHGSSKDHDGENSELMLSDMESVNTPVNDTASDTVIFNAEVKFAMLQY